MDSKKGSPSLDGGLATYLCATTLLHASAILLHATTLPDDLQKSFQISLVKIFAAGQTTTKRCDNAF
ncbi:MAG: hypothetical protein EBU66_04180 [Bacteroidetes bacterium]|nr:hypothetical protein [Bacteroidota bacterium]